MEEVSRELDQTRRLFHDTYLRTTVAVRDALAGTTFHDPAWVEGWDVRFAGLYLDALRAHLHAANVPGPWATAFAAADGPRLPPLRHVLLGINAHINYDLPQALIAVISDQEFDDPAVVTRRSEDHARIDDILASRVAEEDAKLKPFEQPGDRTLLDLLLQPFNHLATKRFLEEARTKVWHNARILSEARRVGQLGDALRDLERLSQARVADLTRPGQVVLDLARRGFGVQLDSLDHQG